MESSVLRHRLEGAAVGVVASTCIFWWFVYAIIKRDDWDPNDKDDKAVKAKEEKQKSPVTPPVRFFGEFIREEPVPPLPTCMKGGRGHKTSSSSSSSSSSTEDKEEGSMQRLSSLLHSQHGRGRAGVMPSITEEHSMVVSPNPPAVTEDHLSLVYTEDMAEAKSMTTVKEEYRFLPRELYSQAVRLLPIVCIDLALQRKSDNKILLVKRGSEPVRGYWWVPGGRMLRNETFFAAAMRKIKEETGSEAKPVKVLGVYNTFFTTSCWDGGTHTVNVGVHMVTDDDDVHLDSTSSAYRWVSAQELGNYDIYVQDLLGAALGEPSCLSRMEAIA